MSNLRIKMHSMYDHFPDKNPVQGQPYIECFSDSHVTECKSPGRNIAMMLEPRSMIGEYYDYVYEHQDYFRYIFTHDSKLLQLPQARFFNWADVWCTTNSVKDKGISLVSSWKDWCPLHKARIELAKYFDDKPWVDCYGSFRGDKDAWTDVKEAHERYKYAIVIENDIDEYWYTEKLLNCFSNRVVPIYVGATRIGDLFNTDGIIQVHNWRIIPEIVRTLDIDEDYLKRHDAINDNFDRVAQYKVNWKDRFFADNEILLERLQNE